MGNSDKKEVATDQADLGEDTGMAMSATDAAALEEELHEVFTHPEAVAIDTEAIYAASQKYPSIIRMLSSSPDPLNILFANKTSAFSMGLLPITLEPELEKLNLLTPGSINRREVTQALREYFEALFTKGNVKEALSKLSAKLTDISSRRRSPRN